MAEKIIKVRVTAGARQEGVEEIKPDYLKIKVTEKAENGKANKRVLELIAQHFGVAKSRPIIVSGYTYKEKIISI